MLLETIYQNFDVKFLINAVLERRKETYLFFWLFPIMKKYD